MASLAHVNVAVSRFEENDPRFAGFVDNLDRINELADKWPGFIWRYISDDDDAEAKRIFENPDLIFNMSLWASPEDLHQYAYQSDHVEIFRQRATWFIPQENPSMALWWLPEGEMPSISDARRRLDLLAQAGPTLDAFTFRSAFEAPDLD